MRIRSSAVASFSEKIVEAVSEFGNREHTMQLRLRGVDVPEVPFYMN